MIRKIDSTTGIKIKIPFTFYEEYDNSLNVRRYGADNLYPNHLVDFYRNSPTLNKCVNRLSEILLGMYDVSNSLITNKILMQLCKDVALFNGFALHISYDGLGNITNCNYVPFETIRLNEQGANGEYTKVTYCADWSTRRTINKKQIDIKRDRVEYYVFTDNIQTRLNRIEAAGGIENYKGEILYYSNTQSYPISPADSVLTYVSSEVGLSNITFRDVRSNGLPSMCLSLPKASDLDANKFAEDLASIQGDENALKIITFEYSSADEKPEVLNLAQESYDTRFTNTKTDCELKIIGAYHQEAFKRLEEGSLGFGSDAVSEIYKFYNFTTRGIRNRIETELKRIDKNFKIEEIVYA